jgi:hypothetical protein
MTVVFRGKTGPKKIATNFYKCYKSSGYLTLYLEYFSSALYSEQFTTAFRAVQHYIRRSATTFLEQRSSIYKVVILGVAPYTALHGAVQHKI